MWCLSHGFVAALTIPTAILGAFTLVTFLLRTWKLVRTNSQCRPVGASRWSCDYFTWNLILGTIASTAVLVTASESEPPNLRQAAMPQAVILYIAGGQLLATALMCHFGWTTPITLSSTLRGHPARPGVLVLAEDIVGVDGGGGQLYRSQLVARYEASPQFRALCQQLNWFWGAGSLAAAVALTVLIYAVNDEDVTFGLGKSRIYITKSHKPDYC